MSPTKMGKTSEQRSRLRSYIFFNSKSWFNFLLGKGHKVDKIYDMSQCPRTDLSKRFLPKPMTTTG